MPPRQRTNNIPTYQIRYNHVDAGAKLELERVAVQKLENKPLSDEILPLHRARLHSLTQVLPPESRLPSF